MGRLIDGDWHPNVSNLATDDINPTGFVPVGPELDFDEPHDRDELPGEPPAALE